MSTHCWDMDGTLCWTCKDDYERAIPRRDAIAEINAQYDRGFHIVIDTARGSATGIDWYELTREQLAKWGVKYHVLRCGVKMPADRYIDDRALRPEELRRAS